MTQFLKRKMFFNLIFEILKICFSKNIHLLGIDVLMKIDSSLSLYQEILCPSYVIVIC